MPGSSSQEIYEKAPNKQLWVTDLANFGVFRRGFNGTMGWQDNPQTGLQEVTGNQLAEFKRSAFMNRQMEVRALIVRFRTEAFTEPADCLSGGKHLPHGYFDRIE